MCTMFESMPTGAVIYLGSSCKLVIFEKLIEHRKQYDDCKHLRLVVESY